ncbi:MAG: hypothetical protein QN198_03025 [Armatimonadota bacterium]|nr:hypothetical protein [Armatimonadota bacterium]MDR5702556.1 hypothetical protein [Armatimonadota bacterium]MDR7434454.1 hypothetical protein [Armatimonadota bacterium]
MGHVDIVELRDTVLRMEQRLRMRPERLVRDLMAAYDELIPRFAADLGDEREELVSRGGALMLIQQVLCKTRQ